MNMTEAIAVLRKHNEWRRAPAHLPEDAMPAMGSPREIGCAIDVLCDEVELMADALKLKTAGEEYAHRLAVMLECALLDRPGTWDDGHALLAEYREACRMADEPPTLMGEPAVTPNA